MRDEVVDLFDELLLDLSILYGMAVLHKRLFAIRHGRSRIDSVPAVYRT